MSEPEKPRPIRTVVVAALVCAAALLASVFMLGGCDNGLQVFATDAWNGEGGILIRNEKTGRTLLLAEATWVADQPPQIGEVYRYDPLKRSLNHVDRAAWYAGEDKVRRFSTPVQNRGADYRTDGWNHLIYRGEQVAVYGDVLVLAQLPGRVLLIVSGTYKRGHVFFGRPPRTSGPYFHQLFSLSDGKLIGGPIRLPLPSDGPVPQLAVPPECDCVMYIGAGHRRLCVVPLTTSGEEE